MNHKSKAIANRFATNPFAKKYKATNEARERGRNVDVTDHATKAMRGIPSSLKRK